MTIDDERVMEKVRFIKEQVTDIRELTSKQSKTEIFSNKFTVKGLKYSLQTAIEAMIDIAFHLVAKKYQYAPKEARDALYVLMQNQVINEKEYKIFTSMVSFRNRMVHLYEDISEERLYMYSTSNLKDFEIFIERILTLINK